jgi:hypothetical protein
VNEQCVEVEARIARALITAFGMLSENMQRQVTGKPTAYDENAFLEIIESEGIGYNGVAYGLHPDRVPR